MNKGVKVELNVDEEVIKSNLERIGIVNRDKKLLYPSCYLIKDEDGSYAIAHFKELLKIPGQDESDIQRRDTIVWLLNNWGLLKSLEPNLKKQKRRLFILSVNQKEDEGWTILHKWNNKTKEKRYG